jgi:hypothetical protein
VQGGAQTKDQYSLQVGTNPCIGHQPWRDCIAGIDLWRSTCIQKEVTASTCLLSNSAPRPRPDAGQKKQSAGRNRKKNRSDRQKKW